jgi:hypothetical protein
MSKQAVIMAPDAEGSGAARHVGHETVTDSALPEASAPAGAGNFPNAKGDGVIAVNKAIPFV